MKKNSGWSVEADANRFRWFFGEDKTADQKAELVAQMQGVGSDLTRWRLLIDNIRARPRKEF